MKKRLVLLLCCITLMGCGKIDNTPIKQVEAYLTKYQTLDDEIVNELNTNVDDNLTLNQEQKNEYMKIMKKNYQNLVYQIMDDKIDGNVAKVTVEIIVNDNSTVIENAKEYYSTHPDEFMNEIGNYDENKYNDYLLAKIGENKEKITYTLDLELTKINGTWQLDEISAVNYEKINGTYNNK